MTEQSVIVMNNLRGIQAEINRLQRMTEEKRDIRKQYITDCLNSGIKVKQIAETLKISVARVYKILEK
jgi:DNA invertase Pin-like site-specific DNA recombinase